MQVVREWQGDGRRGILYLRKVQRGTTRKPALGRPGIAAIARIVTGQAQAEAEAMAPHVQAAARAPTPTSSLVAPRRSGSVRGPRRDCPARAQGAGRSCLHRPALCARGVSHRTRHHLPQPRRTRATAPCLRRRPVTTRPRGRPAAYRSTCSRRRARARNCAKAGRLRCAVQAAAPAWATGRATSFGAPSGEHWLPAETLCGRSRWPAPAEDSTGCTCCPPAGCVSRREAEADAAQEPLLSSFLYASILSHDSFPRSLAFVLSNRLSDATFLSTELFEARAAMRACHASAFRGPCSGTRGP